MHQNPYTAECASCFALCCTALSFQRGNQFGHDKLAGQPCHYLANDFRCRIHAERENLGYDGCEAFDCLGAGQRASAIFAPTNWRQDAATARMLYANFSVLMRLQEMRQALETAAELDLPQRLHEQRREMLQRIAVQADHGDDHLGPETANMLSDAKKFLRGLSAELID